MTTVVRDRLDLFELLHKQAAGRARDFLHEAVAVLAEAVMAATDRVGSSSGARYTRWGSAGLGAVAAFYGAQACCHRTA